MTRSTTRRLGLTAGILILATAVVQAPAAAQAHEPPARDRALTAVRISLYAAQALDYGTTHYALQHGAREANPVMGPIVHQPAAFVGVKVGSALLQDWLVRKIARHNRPAALIVGIAIAGTTTAVAVHNVGVARRER